MVRVIPAKVALWGLWWQAIKQAGLEKEFFQSIRCLKDTDLKYSDSDAAWGISEGKKLSIVNGGKLRIKI